MNLKTKFTTVHLYLPKPDKITEVIAKYNKKKEPF